MHQFLFCTLVMAKPDNLPYSNVGLSMWLGYPVRSCCLLIAVNPKRIHKSKAAAAAEADRESKRSKAVSADQALAEAKAAALASGWDSDDDFETLPKRWRQ